MRVANGRTEAFFLHAIPAVAKALANRRRRRDNCRAWHKACMKNFIGGTSEITFVIQLPHPVRAEMPLHDHLTIEGTKR